MNESQKIESKGFCLYKDTLQTAFQILPSYDERGKLFTNVFQYVTNEDIENFSEKITTCFLFLKNSINITNQKYLKRKKAQKAYYDKKTKKESLDTYNNNNIDNNNNNDNNNDNNIDNNIDNNNDNNNDNYIDIDKNITNSNITNDIDINNSLSNKKYTKKQVKEILERERIFLKNLSFENFWKYNRDNGWKYDPITAAGFYIERHPDCLSIPKEENPTPAAPAPAQGNATKGVLKEVQDALNVWNKLKFETVSSGLIPGADGALLDNVTPLKLTAETTGKKIKRVIAGREIETNEIKTFLLLRVTDKIIAKTLSRNVVFCDFFKREKIELRWIF